MISDNFEELSLFGKIFDYIAHMFLPILCYTIGGFATLTLLMKNSLMEQLNQDYIRTALAKGLTYQQAVFRHGFAECLDSDCHQYRDDYRGNPLRFIC